MVGLKMYMEELLNNITMYQKKLNQFKQEILDYIISSTNNGEIYDIAITSMVRGKVININNGEKLLIKYRIDEHNDVPKDIKQLDINKIAQIADQIYHYGREYT